MEAAARYEDCRMVHGLSESLTNFLEADRDNPGTPIVSSQEMRLQHAERQAVYKQARTSQSHVYRDAALTAMAGTNSNCACDGWCAPPSVCRATPLPSLIATVVVCDQVHGF